jgi:hypothetical protein
MVKAIIIANIIFWLAYAISWATFAVPVPGTDYIVIGTMMFAADALTIWKDSK